MQQGTQIANRYEVIDKLGQGGMGAVYRVYDRLEKTEVALKQVAKSISGTMQSTPSMVGRKKSAIIQEFSLLASLRHPNIISVLDYGLADETPFFTMELVNKPQDFIEIVQTQTPAQQIELIIQILQALRYLHRRGVLHRDLKPDNVIIFDDDRLKVLDFGLGIKSQLAEGRVGTMAYMSPESIRNNMTAPQSDLYAVGVMAYEMITGKVPFDPRDLRSILVKPANMSQLGNHPATPVIKKLLNKLPIERYANADDCIRAFQQAMGIPHTVESINVRESYLQANTFIGRDQEFALLSNELDQILDGNTSFYLIGGESGVGKSRLLNEIRIQALVSGVTVLRGQAVEGGGFPFQLWRNIVRHLVLMVDLTDTQASILADIVPDISLLIQRPITKVPQLIGKAHQDRLVLTIVDLLHHANQPIMLLLEDLQWADESLAVLKQLLLVREQFQQLMIVGTYRDDETPHLSDELTDMKIIQLNRLDRAAMQELTQSMIGQLGTNDQVIELIQKETEGNLFFLVETVRALAEETGGLEQIGMTTLPDGIFTGNMQALTRRRLSKVDARYTAIQNLAAIIGREIDRNLLVHVYGDDTVQAWLRSAGEYSIVTVQDNTWRFAHDKLRETIIADIPDNELANIHQTAAETIEAVYADDTSYNEALLSHWQVTGDLDKIYHYTLPVTQKMIKITGAYSQAETLLTSLLDRLSSDDARRVIPLNSLADSVRRHGDYELGKNYATQAQHLATINDDFHELATSLHILGIIAYSQADYDQATNLYQQSMTIRQNLNDQRGIANSLNNLAGVAWNQGNYEEATNLYEQSLAIRQQLGDQSGIADSLYNLGVIVRNQGDHERAMDLYQQSLAIKQQLGDRYVISLILNVLGIIAMNQDDYEGATDLYQQSLEIKQQLGDQSGISATLHNLGIVAYSQEDYEKATDFFQQSLTMRQQLGDQSGVAATLISLGRIAQQQGQIGYKNFYQSLVIAQEIHATTQILLNIVSFAAYFITQGQTERATQLVGFAQLHPSQNDDVRQYLDEILPKLETLLPPTDLAIALEQGKYLDLDTVVQELLDEFASATSDVSEDNE